jgi:hypothetical protein
MQPPLLSALSGRQLPPAAADDDAVDRDSALCRRQRRRRWRRERRRRRRAGRAAAEVHQPGGRGAGALMGTLVGVFDDAARRFGGWTQPEMMGSERTGSGWFPGEWGVEGGQAGRRLGGVGRGICVSHRSASMGMITLAPPCLPAGAALMWRRGSASRSARHCSSISISLDGAVGRKRGASEDYGGVRASVWGRRVAGEGCVPTPQQHHHPILQRPAGANQPTLHNHNISKPTVAPWPYFAARKSPAIWRAPAASHPPRSRFGPATSAVRTDCAAPF